MKMLIVDDNAAVRRLIRSFVESDGDQIRECENGAEAAEMYEEFCPDVVLTDLSMPGMDGMVLTRLIRSKRLDAKVIVISNHGEASLRAEAIEAGVEAYLLKDDLSRLVPLLTGLRQTIHP